MTRRHFLYASSLAAATAQPRNRWILVHEHILVDFADAKDIAPGRYKIDEVVESALPKLREIRELGCVRFHDCTPNYLGRDGRLLSRLARESGVEIWTNTGLYSAREHRHLPEFVKSETSNQLAARWIAEAREGIDGGIMKPRFIKIGVNRGPLDELDRKIVEAAALTSKATGLVICSHTGDGSAALEQFEIIVRKGGVRPEKFVWVHAQNELDLGIHERIAKSGSWVEFDGIGKPSADWHLRCVQHMDRRKLLKRVLVSQDAGWYSVGQPGGGNFRGFAFLHTGFAPRLTASQRETLLWKNPQRCFGS
jgi:phosphotriesterase-related protein